jgi:hypothetical protein
MKYSIALLLPQASTSSLCEFDDSMLQKVRRTTWPIVSETVAAFTLSGNAHAQ